MTMKFRIPSANEQRYYLLIFVFISFALLFRSPKKKSKDNEDEKFRYYRWRGSNPSSFSPPNSNLSARTGWNFENTEKFCKKNVKRPRMYSSCERHQESKQCKDGSFVMFSQFFQDYYLFTRHFSKLKRRGIYVDLAANHPWRISNTYFMDACLGWDGICIEPLSGFEKLLKSDRTCTVLTKCVSHMDGDKISFVSKGVLSGSAETNKEMEKWNKTGEQLHQIPMECTTLNSIFMNYDVKHVDYLSLDVEGHEKRVLQGIRWKEVRINIITVETSPSTIDDIDTFLLGKGYYRHIPDLNDRSKRTKLLKEDAIYVHPSVTFGSPN